MTLRWSTRAHVINPALIKCYRQILRIVRWLLINVIKLFCSLTGKTGNRCYAVLLPQNHLTMTLIYILLSLILAGIIFIIWINASADKSNHGKTLAEIKYRVDNFNSEVARIEAAVKNEMVINRQGKQYRC